MQMKITFARVSGVADITDQLASDDFVARIHILSSFLKVPIIEHVFTVHRELIYGDAPRHAIEEPSDHTIRSRNYRCTLRGNYVYRIVASTSAACLLKSIDELVGPDSLYRDDQIQFSALRRQSGLKLFTYR